MTQHCHQTSLERSASGLHNSTSPKSACRAAGSLLAAFWLSGSMLSTAQAQTVPSNLANLPLVQSHNMVYQGAFRVPYEWTPSGGDVATLNFGGSALGFNPTRNSLVLACMEQDTRITEIAIPALTNSTNISSLKTATTLQPCTSVFGGLQDNDATNRVGGMYILPSGKMVGTKWVYYDANGDQRLTHFTLDNPARFSASPLDGLYAVGGNGSPRSKAGTITSIPPDWQSTFGYPYLTGFSGGSIVSALSYCQAVTGFDPNQLGVVHPVPGFTYMYCQLDNYIGGKFDQSGKTNPYFNANTSVRGIFFVPGTRSVLFFGTHGDGDICYKETCPFFAGGYASADGIYHTRVWAYDALDLIAVRNGTKAKNQVLPYAYWDLDNYPLFKTGNQESVGGVAYDASKGILYLSQKGGDTAQSTSYLPLIQAFTFTIGFFAQPLETAH
jgi:hypothetical protein